MGNCLFLTLSNCTADQCLCFRYADSTSPLLLIAKILCLLPASVIVQAGLCLIWSETSKTGSLVKQLIYEPQLEKTGPTQTGLHSHREVLDA